MDGWHAVCCGPARSSFSSGVRNLFFDIADFFLCLASDFFHQTFGFLLIASDEVAQLALHFAGCFFDCAFDLIFVHLLPFGCC